MLAKSAISAAHAAFSIRQSNLAFILCTLMTIIIGAAGGGGDGLIPPIHKGKNLPREKCMGIMEFEVCRRGRDAQWVVRVGNAVYGAYLDKEQALLDAVDAARDALQSGREAQVWIRDRSSAARIF
jgi:hypothetical protein